MIENTKPVEKPINMHNQPNQFAKWFSRSKALLFVLLFSVAILATAIFQLTTKNKWLNEEFKKQEEFIKQKETFERLGFFIKTAESASRGYVLSGNKKFIESFALTIDSIRATAMYLQQLEELEEITQNKSQLQGLNDLIERKIVFMQQVNKVADVNRPSATVLIATGEGLRLSDSIRGINTSIILNYKLQLQQAKSSFWMAKSVITNIVFYSAALTMLLIILVFWLLFREIGRTKKAAEALQLQTEHYQTTLNSISEGLITTGKNGDIHYMNLAAERMTGWQHQEAKSQPLDDIYDVVNEETGKPIENIVKRILKEGKAVGMENNTILKTKHAHALVISNAGSPLFDLNGAITGTVLVFNDVTERKKNEIALLDRERQYSELIQNLPAAIYTCDELGYIKLYNKAAVALWGREPKAGKDKWCGSWKIFTVDGKDWPIDSCPMAVALKEGRSVHGEQIMIQQPNGNYRHVLPHPTPLFNAEGKLTGGVNMLVDITDKKEREKLIKQTEEKYRTLIEQASEGILVYSLDGNIYTSNQAVYKMLGYTKEEFEKLNLRHILVDEMPASPINIERTKRGETVLCNSTFKRKDGLPLEVEINSKLSPNGNIIAFVRDITDRRLAEVELKKLSLVAKKTINTVIITDAEERIQWVNEAFTRLTGYELNEVIGKRPGSFLKGPETNPVVVRYMRMKIRNRQAFECDIINYSKAGKKHWIRIQCQPEFNSTGKLTGFFSIQTEITKEKEAEAAKLILTERLALATTSAKIGIWDWDIVKNVMVWDERMFELYGIKKTQVAGVIDNWQNRLQPDETEKLGKAMRDAMDGTADFDITFRVLWPYQSVRFIKSQGHVVRDKQGNALRMLGVNWDVTERKNAEKELRESELFNRSLLTSISSHIAVMDEEGKLITVNKAWSDFSKNNGVSTLKRTRPGSNYFDVCGQAALAGDTTGAEALAGIKQVLSKAIPFFEIEYPCHSPSEQRWFLMRVTHFIGKAPKVVIVHTDITTRKLSEKQRLIALELYDTLAKATSDTIWDWDICRNKMLYNDGITKMLGFERSEVENVADWWKENIHPDDLNLVSVALDKIFKTRGQSFQLEYRFHCGDGSYKYIFDRAFVIYDEHGKPSRVIGAMQDVTHKKEEEIRIAKAIVEAQEQERKQLGMELHDNVNQLLTASLLYLGLANERQKTNKDSSELLDTCKTHIMSAIGEARKLSHQLAPAANEDISMKDVFEQLILNMNSSSRFKVNFHFDDFESEIIGQGIQIALYRILQEQLNNIVKYAEAGMVKVSVTLNDGTIKLIIVDNGKGFDTKAVKNGIGLENIKRRTEMYSGKFTCTSSPGNGCEVVVVMPLGRVGLGV